MSKWKFQQPEGTKSLNGIMSFISEDERTYRIGGRTYTDIWDCVDEYKLLMEIQHGHDWSFPVASRITERANTLKQNLMDLHKEPKNGRNVQHTKNTKAAGSSRGGGVTDNGGHGGKNETKEAQGQKRNDTDGRTRPRY